MHRHPLNPSVWVVILFFVCIYESLDGVSLRFSFPGGGIRSGGPRRSYLTGSAPRIPVFRGGRNYGHYTPPFSSPLPVSSSKFIVKPLNCYSTSTGNESNPACRNFVRPNFNNVRTVKLLDAVLESGLSSDISENESNSLKLTSVLGESLILFGDETFSLATEVSEHGVSRESSIFLQDLAKYPILESLLVQTIKYYYTLFDVLARHSVKSQFATDNQDLFGLSSEVMRMPDFQQFLIHHQSQLNKDARHSSTAFFAMFPNDTSSDVASYIFGLTNINLRMLNHFWLESRASNIFLSAPTIGYLCEILEKVVLDLRFLDRIGVVKFFDFKDKTGLIWLANSNPDTSNDVSHDLLSQYANLSGSSYHPAARRVMGLMEELRSHSALYSMIVGLDVIHDAILAYSMPTQVAWAYRGDNLLSCDEVHGYLLRGRAAGVSAPSFVQAKLVRTLIQLNTAHTAIRSKTRRVVAVIMGIRDGQSNPSFRFQSGVSPPNFSVECLLDLILVLLGFYDLEVGLILGESSSASAALQALVAGHLAWIREEVSRLDDLLMDGKPSRFFTDFMLKEQCKTLQVYVLKSLSLFGV